MAEYFGYVYNSFDESKIPHARFEVASAVDKILFSGYTSLEILGGDETIPHDKGGFHFVSPLQYIFIRFSKVGYDNTFWERAQPGVLNAFPMNPTKKIASYKTVKSITNWEGSEPMTKCPTLSDMQGAMDNNIYIATITEPNRLLRSDYIKTKKNPYCYAIPESYEYLAKWNETAGIDMKPTAIGGAHFPIIRIEDAQTGEQKVDWLKYDDSDMDIILLLEENNENDTRTALITYGVTSPSKDRKQNYIDSFQIRLSQLPEGKFTYHSHWDSNGSAVSEDGANYRLELPLIKEQPYTFVIELAEQKEPISTIDNTISVKMQWEMEEGDSYASFGTGLTQSEAEAAALCRKQHSLNETITIIGNETYLSFCSFISEMPLPREETLRLSMPCKDMNGKICSTTEFIIQFTY